MIENTFISTTVNRAFKGLETMLGITQQEDEEKRKAETAKRLKAHKAKKKKLKDDPDSLPF